MLSFTDWKQNKQQQPNNVVAEDSSDKSQIEDTDIAELIAELDELKTKRRSLIKNSENLGAQLLDIDIEILKLEIEKHKLNARRGELERAVEVSKSRKKEGKIESTEDEED